MVTPLTMRTTTTTEGLVECSLSLIVRDLVELVQLCFGLSKECGDFQHAVAVAVLFLDGDLRYNFRNLTWAAVWG